MKDKIVLITGASGGIGAVMTKQFADIGSAIIIHYNSNRNGAEKLLTEIPDNNHMIVGGDLGDSNIVKNIVDSVIEKYGRIDVLINNAGTAIKHPIENVDYEAWQKSWNATIQTNLIGPANLTYLTAKEMVKMGGGKVINISSRGAFRGEPSQPAYGASKAGLNAMGQSLAVALAPKKVYIYTIAPGFVETAMARPYMKGDFKKDVMSQSPLGRVAKPEEIAKTAVFLASEGTDFLTGCIIDVNGASYLRS